MRDRQELSVHFQDAVSARQNWGWFFGLGLALVLLGGLAISYSYATTLFSVLLFGALLATTGVVQVIQSHMARDWSGTFISILIGILYIIAGGLCLIKPEMSAVSLTLLIAILCIVGGIFKMVASLLTRFDRWGWVFFNGLVTLILGMMIYSEWPASGLVIIGLFIGVDLLLTGWCWILLSLAARRALKG